MKVVFNTAEFYKTLDAALAEFTYEFSLLCRKVIETDRLWEGWETSNPLRDIVDTNAINESMSSVEESSLYYAVQWATEYVLYVYFGYALPDGRRIPPRKWAQLAVDENDTLALFGSILRKHFNN